MAGVLQLSAVSIVAKHREWRRNEECGQKGIFRATLLKNHTSPNGSYSIYRPNFRYLELLCPNRCCLCKFAYQFFPYPFIELGIFSTFTTFATPEEKRLKLLVRIAGSGSFCKCHRFIVCLVAEARYNGKIRFPPTAAGASPLARSRTKSIYLLTIGQF